MSLTQSSIGTSIVKRDGRLQAFDRRKVESFLRTMSWGLDTSALKFADVVDGLTSRLPAEPMGSEAFLVFLAETIASCSSQHPDYSLLSGRVHVCYHHGRVPKTFSEWVLSYENALPRVFADDILALVRRHASTLDAAILHRRDFNFTYRTLHIFERSYLLKDGQDVAERVQFLFMRTALGIHGDAIPDVLEAYELLSTRKLSFASPILWNGGLATRSFASCYIYEPMAVEAGDAVANLSALSKMWASNGGIGISAGDVPATRRSSVDGHHPGLLPLLRVYDAVAAFWSKSSRHRASSAAVYLPIWHCDVRKFVLSRTNRAAVDYRFHHLFPALWIPDLFMQRLEADESWALFDPATVPGLSNLYGNAFSEAYGVYERQGLQTANIRARALWAIVGDAIRETGSPFIMFSDNVNARNNQMNLGIIKSSNLCTEITQYSSTVDTAVCLLASVCLPRFLRGDGTFNYPDLHRVTKFAVWSLDRLLERTNYPTTDSAVSMYRTRSIGVGVQGLADTFAFLGHPFTSPVARTVNRDIFETVYHAALESSCELAETLGAYDAWDGSPAQQGILQLDMWNGDTSGNYDFDAIRQRARKTGLRNSVLTAQMPTSSTAQIFGNSEGVDPPVSNVTQYRVLSGTFNEVSRPLVAALQRRGLWTERIRTDILAARGSVQSIESFPEDLKQVFKTAFEIDPRDIVDMAADRAPFIDQSQSLSLFLPDITASELMDVQLRAWKAGLKTGAYYVRGKAASEPLPFGVQQHFTTSSSSSGTSSGVSAYVDASGCSCSG